MRIIDNSPIDLPAVGTFLSTATPVWQLELNRIYVLSHASDELKAEAREVGAHLEKTLADQTYLNLHRTVVLDESVDCDDQEHLSEALSGDSYDLVMPMARPSRDDFQYLFAKGEKGRMLNILASMCSTAERVTRESLIEAIIKALQSDPEGTLKILSPAFESMEFKENLVTSGLTLSLIKPSFGALPSAGMLGVAAGVVAGVVPELVKNLSKFFGINPDDTEIQKNNKIYSQLDRIQEFQNEYPQDDIASVVHPMLGNLPGEYMMKVVAESCKGTPDSYKYFDPTYYAKKSPLKLKVVKREEKADYFNIHGRRHTDGKYVLFMEKEGKDEHVHFSQRAYFIVYLIYLLDRKTRKDKVTPIHLKDEELLYKSLYDVVYPRDGQRDSSYFSLTSKVDRDGKLKRTPKFKDALKGIYECIKKSCLTIDEFEGTHYIHNSQSHLYTLPDNIIIHRDVEEIAKKCKKV
ncbi:MAG: hypothetical protein LIO91_13655 [Bacteroidales bacterium]|nr:hypothetical protein [Bacteroidales bacterium]